MKTQNLFRPSSSDQFLKKGGFKVFYIDKSNISSIGRLMGPLKKTKNRYPSIHFSNQLQPAKQSSSFSNSCLELEFQQKSTQKIQVQKTSLQSKIGKRKEKKSVISSQIQNKIREIIRMNSIKKEQQNNQAKLFRQRIQKVISSISNIGALTNQNKNSKEQNHTQNNSNGQFDNKGNAIMKKNGQKARQKPIKVQKTNFIKVEKHLQIQPAQESQKSLVFNQMNGKQVCQRMTRTKLRNGSLEHQSFFQLEIKPKFHKKLVDTLRLKQQGEVKKEKVEKPSLKKKIKKVKKKEENLYYSKFSKQQKQILNTILINNLPPRNPTVKHQHNSIDSNEVVLKSIIKDNKLYFASQMLHYNSKTNSLSIKCTPRYYSFVNQTLKSSQHCKTIAQVPSQQAIKKIKLKRNFQYTNKKTLVLDLDQTLIHSQGLNQQADKEIFPFSFEFDKTTRHYAIRNYAKQFVRNLSQKYYIVVFTSAVQGYADNILQHIDPQQKYIQHRLYRSNCYLHGQKYPYIKDLRILNRDLSQIIIVDNSLYAFWFNIDNGVPIISFTGIQDEELCKLQNYLLLLQNVDDVRKVNRRAFHLHLYKDHQSCNDLLSNYCNLMKQEAAINQAEVIEI